MDNKFKWTIFYLLWEKFGIPKRSREEMKHGIQCHFTSWGFKVDELGLGFWGDWLDFCSLETVKKSNQFVLLTAKEIAVSPHIIGVVSEIRIQSFEVNSRHVFVWNKETDKKKSEILKSYLPINPWGKKKRKGKIKKEKNTKDVYQITSKRGEERSVNFIVFFSFFLNNYNKSERRKEQTTGKLSNHLHFYIFALLDIDVYKSVLKL